MLTPKRRMHQELERVLREAGASLVGVSSCSDYFPEYTTAVTIGVSFLTFYQRKKRDMRAVNETMDFLNAKARQFFSDEGYGGWGSLFSQESQQFISPHRILAVRAGLGTVGKNFLVITPQFGPRVHFTTVLTTMPLLSGFPIKSNPCENCSVCVRACPSNALREYFHAEACTKCYTCVFTCPAGEDIDVVDPGEMQAYFSLT